jgi:hypothetical protein
MLNGPCEPRPSTPPWFEERFADGEVRSVRVEGGRAEAVIQNSNSGESRLNDDRLLRVRRGARELIRRSRPTRLAQECQVAGVGQCPPDGWD